MRMRKNTDSGLITKTTEESVGEITRNLHFNMLPQANATRFGKSRYIEYLQRRERLLLLQYGLL